MTDGDQESVYVARNNSRRVYHTQPDCRYGPSRETTLTREQAHANGLRECKYCDPERRVRENPGKTNRPCPFCGKQDINSFPSHRPECPEV